MKAEEGCMAMQLHRKQRIVRGAGLVLAALLAGSAWASVAQADSDGDVITVKRIGMKLAARIAEKAVDVCQAKGYNVTAVVVDRTGDPQVVMRGTRASRFTIQIATDKARAVVLGGVDSSVFRHNREDIRMEMDNVDGILVLAGGVRINSAGAMIGALGVSGAPGGEKDEACAKEAVADYLDRLELGG